MPMSFTIGRVSVLGIYIYIYFFSVSVFFLVVGFEARLLGFASGLLGQQAFLVSPASIRLLCFSALPLARCSASWLLPFWAFWLLGFCSFLAFFLASPSTLLVFKAFQADSEKTHPFPSLWKKSREDNGCPRGRLCGSFVCKWEGALPHPPSDLLRF